MARLPRRRGFATRAMARRQGLSVVRARSYMTTGGYDDERILEIVASKTHDLLRGERLPLDPAQSMVLLGVLLAADRAAHADILEFGGACGAMFHAIDRAAPSRIGHWHVVESPGMAALGSARFATDRLSFSERIELRPPSVGATVAVAVGAIQYSGDPLGVLNELIVSRPDVIVVCRTPVVLDAEYPVHVRQRTRVSDHGPSTRPGDCADPLDLELTAVPRAALSAALGDDYEVLIDRTEQMTWPLPSISVAEHAVVARRKE